MMLRVEFRSTEVNEWNTKNGFDINENKEIPTITTFCRYFRTTKMSKVWEEVLK
ncbi:hypothetical protein [Clostridium botulinum]|uniref:hypothetical protein n=1 Tax=Clostridium botulinum TaxID=1491 RepID=UPI0002EC8605|nr:hypothetical protein [Clostridium botulinum]KLU74187.1 hypothetical protein CBC3_p0327 [Clostridium botulinum V891]